jgi:hypothetical protein
MDWTARPCELRDVEREERLWRLCDEVLSRPPRTATA